MLARIVYPVLVLAPRCLAPSFPVPGPKSTARGSQSTPARSARAARHPSPVGSAPLPVPDRDRSPLTKWDPTPGPVEDRPAAGYGLE